MIKAIIFDMDGLMIETEHLHGKSFVHILKMHGKKPRFNEDGIVQIVGMTARDNLLRLKKMYDIDTDIDTLFRTRQKIYAGLLRKNLKPRPGLLPLIKKLRKEKLKLALASSSSMTHIKIVLNGLKIKKYFHAVISGEDIPRSKPHPDIFLKTAKQLRVKPLECVVLEDSHSGVEAAYRAGMKVVAVPNKFTRSHNFDKATRIVASLSKISPKLIQNL